MTHDTVAAGMVEHAPAAPAATIAPRLRPGTRGTSIARFAGGHRRARCGVLAHRPARLRGVDDRGGASSATLVERGRLAYLLDGDNIRHGLSGDLPRFDPPRGARTSGASAHVARLFARRGRGGVVSLVSPVPRGPRRPGGCTRPRGLEFVELFVDTPIEECARRDPKGLYASARAGRLTGRTGEGAPYEPPEAAEIVIRGEPTETSARRLIEALG